MKDDYTDNSWAWHDVVIDVMAVGAILAAAFGWI